MPRKCTICEHPHRTEIEKAIVRNDSNRAIASRFDVSRGAVQRHTDNHLPAAIVHAEESKAEVRSIDIMGELQEHYGFARRLRDACDRWLRDVDDPTQYDIGPRAEEVKVTYLEPDGDGGTVRRKEKLSDLLPRIEEGGRTVAMVETKHADPRELVLKALARLENQLELIARLMGELKNETTTINVHLHPEWVQLRSRILSTLEPYPDARLAIAQALSQKGSDVRN